MELIYIWIKAFRNYVDTDINFSEHFNIKYCKDYGNIDIVKNDKYVSIYPEHITNINAIVGKNSVGKTNLLDCIGLRKSDRNKNSEEVKIEYKSNEKKHFLQATEIELITKKHIYFLIYYLGKDTNDEDLFCIEGNDIESFKEIFEPHEQLDDIYWLEKHWFPFVCKYKNGKFIYNYMIDKKMGKSETKVINNEIRVYGDYRSEQDKLAIITMRDNLNEKYYDSRSIQTDDETYIMIPRRVGTYESKFLASTIKLLYKQVKNHSSYMYKDEKYILTIEYTDFFLKNSSSEENFNLMLRHTYKDVQNNNKEIFRMLESVIRFYFARIIRFKDITDGNKNECKSKIQEYNFITVNDEAYKNYYLNLVEIISEYMFDNVEDRKHLISGYINLANTLFNNNAYYLAGNKIILKITKESHIEDINQIINVTIDEKVVSEFNDTFSVFNDFFNYSITDLSDGEKAYLGIFSGIYEQITTLTSGKEKFILTLDEPEIRMHPELARNFINDLMMFLGDIKKENQYFQIIIATHSPFLLSDIPKENVVFLKKGGTKCEIYDEKIETFGQDIHKLLKSGFFMDTTMGEFARIKISKLIKSIIPIKGEKNKMIYPKINESQYTILKKQINIIGEQVIKEKLIYMLEECYEQSLSGDDRTIQKLEMEKKILEEKIRRLKGLN